MQVHAFSSLHVSRSKTLPSLLEVEATGCQDSPSQLQVNGTVDFARQKSLDLIFQSANHLVLGGLPRAISVFEKALQLVVPVVYLVPFLIKCLIDSTYRKPAIILEIDNIIKTLSVR